MTSRAGRFNGWQRIGIVLSVLWLVPAFVLERRMMYVPIAENYGSCVRVATHWACNEIRKNDYAYADKLQPFIFALITLVPITALWLFGYVIAWIRRGFQPKSA